MMKEERNKILRKLRIDLLATMEKTARAKPPKSGKLFLYILFSLNKNLTNKIINNASIHKINFPPDAVNSCLDNGWVKECTQKRKINHIILTATGLYKIEEQENLCSIEEIMNQLQGKKFEGGVKGKSFKDTTLSSKEILISIALICFGAFSAESRLTHKNKEKDIKILFNDIFSFFKGKGVFPNEQFDDIISNDEHIGEYFKHLNNLSVRTQGLFNNPGGSRYYLDLYVNDQFDENLRTIISCIFSNNKYSRDECKEIYTFIITMNSTFHLKMRSPNLKIKKEQQEKLRKCLFYCLVH